MKPSNSKRPSAQKHHREVTPQPTRKEAPNKSNLSVTPLRSNIRKPSNQKSAKKVVIHDPNIQNKVRDLLYGIQQFFIRKIMKYEQEAFDALQKPYLREKEIEDRIRLNHENLLQRQVLSDWIKAFQASQKKKQLTAKQTSQKRIFQRKLTPFEQDEENLNNQIDLYNRQRLLKIAFGQIRKDYVEVELKNATGESKTTSIQNNLSRFLSDQAPVVGTNEQLKSAIQSFKHHLPKRDIKSIKNKRKALNNTSTINNTSALNNTQAQFSTPNNTSKKGLSNHKRSESRQKETQSSVNLFNHHQNIKKILFTDATSPNNDKLSSRRDQSAEKLKNNLSTSKIESKHQRCPSQPAMLKGQPNHYKNLSDMVQRTVKTRDPVALVNVLQKILKRNQDPMFEEFKQEQKVQAFRDESLKRKVFFSWTQLVPEMKVEKFQLKFRLEKLVKSIKKPFFKVIKSAQVKKKVSADPAMDRISQFLDSDKKKKKK